jgi:hypothetical protein
LQDRRQNKLRLGVSGRDSQAAAAVIAEIPRRLADVLDVVKQIRDVLEDSLPGRRDRG